MWKSCPLGSGGVSLSSLTFSSLNFRNISPLVALFKVAIFLKVKAKHFWEYQRHPPSHHHKPTICFDSLLDNLLLSQVPLQDTVTGIAADDAHCLFEHHTVGPCLAKFDFSEHVFLLQEKIKGVDIWNISRGAALRFEDGNCRHQFVVVNIICHYNKRACLLPSRRRQWRGRLEGATSGPPALWSVLVSRNFLWNQIGGGD